MTATPDAAHDEINLYRLVRRLEKARETWDGTPLRADSTGRARVQKELQVRASSLFIHCPADLATESQVCKETGQEC